MSNLRIGAIAVAGLLGMALVARTCGYGEPIVIPDWQDSLRVVREEYRVERVRIAAEQARLQSHADSMSGLASEWRRRSLANRPTRPVPNPGTIPPDSGTQTKLTDSLGLVYAQNDSLWAALDAADSAYADLSTAFDAQKQATAAALAGWASADSTLDRANRTAGRAIASLTASLKKARRGCRVLGLLPCPVAYAGLGATISGGSVSTGLSVGIGVPIRF